MQKKAFAAIIFTLLASLSGACANKTEPVPATVTPTAAPALIAIYSGKGTWEDSITAAGKMLEWMGYRVEHVDAASVNAGGLDRFAAILVPGGDMYQYAQDISPAGMENILEFVANGHGYIGICGGAYFASRNVIWQGNQLPMRSLGLFPGTAQGPLDRIKPYPDYAMTELRITGPANPITAGIADPWMLYYWGPALIPDDGSDVSVLATSATGEEAMMAALEYEQGRVFLVATHPEIEEDDPRDGTGAADELDDQGSDWDLMKQAVRWVLEGK